MTVPVHFWLLPATILSAAVGSSFALTPALIALPNAQATIAPSTVTQSVHMAGK